MKDKKGFRTYFVQKQKYKSNILCQPDRSCNLKGLKSDVTQNILNMTKIPLAVGTQTKLIKCGKGHSASKPEHFTFNEAAPNRDGR